MILHRSIGRRVRHQTLSTNTEHPMKPPSLHYPQLIVYQYGLYDQLQLKVPYKRRYEYQQVALFHNVISISSVSGLNVPLRVSDTHL